MILFPPVGLYLYDTPFIYFVKLFIGLNWTKKGSRHFPGKTIKDSEPERVLEYQGRLDQIESSINRIRMPLTFFGEVYRLKEYVDSVRGKLARLSDPSEENNS
jgi:hypothetical protein